MQSKHEFKTRFEGLFIRRLRCLSFGALVSLMLSMAVTALAQNQLPQTPPPNPPAQAPVEVAPAENEAGDAVPAVQVEKVEQEIEDDLEVEEVQAVARAGNPWGVEPRKLLAAKHFQLSQIFQVEIDRIGQVCQLDAKQALKLKIGAKGVVKKLADKWQETAGQQFEMALAQEVDDEDADEDAENKPDGDGEKSDTPDDDQELIEITDADEIDEMTMQVVMMDEMGNPFKSVRPTDSEIWTKMIRSVLTEEQSQKLADFHRDQKIARRTAMIALVLETFAQELALTSEQRTAIGKLITPSLEKAEINCAGFYETFVVYYHASKVSKKELKTILSPAQYQQFQLFVGPSKQIGQMMEMEAGGMVVGGEVEINFIAEVVQEIGELLDGFEWFFGE